MDEASGRPHHGMRGAQETAGNTLKKTINRSSAQHEDTFDSGNMRDLLDMYMSMRSGADVGSSFHGQIGKKNQQIGLLQLFLAGYFWNVSSI